MAKPRLGRLAHLTLETGHLRADSRRSEVGADAIATLHPLLVAGGGETPGWALSIDLIRRRGRDAQFRILDSRSLAPLVHGWLGVTAPRAMWRRATDHYRRAYGRDYLGAMPPAPWLAVSVVLVEVLLSRPDVVGALGDLERCIAWALLDPPATH